ncbi:hypothetical protein Fcan01_20995 [Folsomia candida]|uniref:Uncharacterized protein n=1 Tax=Folsomia candida TaxID=158441 RepID=A0A226DHD7_FOLCA|nr:hypothetical protein Fcan01_20995 [Folsomia candida]
MHRKWSRRDNIELSPPASTRSQQLTPTRCLPFIRGKRLFRSSTSFYSESQVSPKTLEVNRSCLGKARTYGRSSEIVQDPEIPNLATEPVAKLPEGRRLFTMTSLENMMEMAADHARVCNRPKWRIVSENRKGFLTTLSALCIRCKSTIAFDNDDGAKCLAVNTASAWAGNTTGAGYTILKHIFTAMDVPTIAFNSYIEHDKKLAEQIKNSWTLVENGQEEKGLAIELGQVDSDGTPWTWVYGDGQWSKRSYNHVGLALSGSAVIIGGLSRKPLFIGVRNKSCIICSRNGNKVHDGCFKNFKGSASEMETSIIREGFANSIEQHGLRYKKYIGDGDSSVHVAIKDVYITESYFTTVEKITCSIHGPRAMSRSLYGLAALSAPAHNYPVQYRQALKERIHLFGKFAKYMIGNHMEKAPVTNSTSLAKDLRALHYHIFEDHSKCSTHVCDDGKIIVPMKYRKPTNIASNSPKLKKVPDGIQGHRFWTAISDIVNRFADLSPSLMQNKNTNIAELFQAHVNKFLQGRRTNVVMRGSYNKKVMEAGFSFLYGTTWYVELYRSVFDENPSDLWIQERSKELKKTENRKSKPRKKRLRVAFCTSAPLPPFFSRKQKINGDKDYGLYAERDDMSPDLLQEKLNDFILQKSVSSREEQWNIHLETIGQHSNPRYKDRRKGMLTASIAGKLLGLKDSTSNVGTLDGLLYPDDISNKPPIVWGHTNESKARSLYQQRLKWEDNDREVEVSDAGLFVCLEFGVLGASPDGIVYDHGEEGIVEIKCPYTERYGLPGEVAKRKTNAFLEEYEENGTKHYRLRKSSHYYDQAVMQLHITRRIFCDLVVWTQGPMTRNELTGEDCPITKEGHLIRIRIYRDGETQKRWDKIRLKLTRFFLEDYGPELVDSRIDRNMGYRQPLYRKQKIDELADKKTNSQPPRMPRKRKYEHDPHRVVVVGGGDVHTVASCRRVGSWEGVGSKAGRELRWGGGKRRG